MGVRASAVEGLVMDPFASAFEGRSVFVTGHTGFIGSWLCIWLHKLGAKVTGYSLAPPTEPSNFELSGVKELLARHHEADIRDSGQLREALAAAEPDVVFHLAAQSLVRRGYAEPFETFDVNVMGTCSLLDALRSLGRSCAVVVFTSDKCYENRETVSGYRETDPVGGHDPYSASKGACEILVSAYRRSFFNVSKAGVPAVLLASARAGNAIGGGDWGEDRLLADVVRSLSKGEPVRVRNPKAVRPWQHVLSPVSGILTLAGKLMEPDGARFVGAWNFGPHANDAMGVRALVEMLIAELGRGSWVDASDQSQPHEAKLLRLAIDKAVWELGWKPRWSLSEAVRKTAAWYRRWNDGGGPMRQACLEDIEVYLSAH